MGAKDRWTQSFKCSGCGQDGVIEFSENDYRYTPPERNAESKEGSFSVVMKDKLDAAATCKKCGAVTIV